MKPRDSQLRLKQFELDEKKRKVADIEMMVAEFTRMASDLDQQIAAEEARAGVSDVKHFSYPPFAKAARTRRDNLLHSVGELNDKLDEARNDLAQLEERSRRAEELGDRANESSFAMKRPRPGGGGLRNRQGRRLTQRA